MDENQELRQEEINLMDLIFYCLEKWRWIVVVMIILAVLAGAYKYRGTVQENQAKQKEAEEALELAKAEEVDNKDVNDVKVDMQSVELYEQAIAENKAALDKQKEYMDTSAVMEMDPYHVSTGTLSYALDGTDHVDSLVASYNAYVSDGRMAESLHKAESDISVTDLRYLTSFSNSFTPLYKIGSGQGIEGSAPENTVFQIRLRMPDQSSCRKYLKAAHESIVAYSAELRAELGEHNLTLLASSQSESMDSDIKAYQDNTRTACITAVKNLQTLRTELDALKSTAVIPEQPDETGTIEIDLANPKTAAVKYAIVGLVLGVFAVCFVLMLMYMMGGKLRNTDNFNARFGMPLIGAVRTPGKKKKLFGFIDNLVLRLKEGAYASIGYEEQIKMAASNVQAAIARNSAGGTLTKVMLAGTVAEKDAADLCTRLSAELQGISLSPYMQIVYQSSALKDLENYDGVLFLEKKGTSDASLILQERKSASDRNVIILGAIVLY